MSNETKKGLSPVAWVAIGCGALALVVVLGVVAAGGFAFFKVKEIVDQNVDVDEEGNVSISTPEGKIEFDASGESGSVKVTGKDGSEATWGVNASLEDVPEWVREMLYPDATETQGTFHTSTPEGATGIVSITTGDAPEEVAAFYKEKLEGAGYEIINETTTSTPQGRITTVAGEDSGAGRTLNVGVVEHDQQTQITLNYNDKS